MELKCLHAYVSAELELQPGQTTEGTEVSEEKKQQMLADFPEWFEKIEVGDEKEELGDAVKTTKKRK